MQQVQLLVVMTLLKNNQGQVLAQVRHDPDFPIKHNKWELTGGKVEYHETPEQAVIRETKEESGLDVEVISLHPKVHVQYWTNKSTGVEYKCVLLTHVCRMTGGQLINPPEDPKISEIRFLDPHEIESLEWGSDVDKNLILEFSRQ